MRRWWLAITPDLRLTRVLLIHEAVKSVLGARLPQGPQHPQAVQSLIETLSLWHRKSLHVVLAVDSQGSSCAARSAHRWRAALELLTGLPLYRIEYSQEIQSDALMHRQLEARLPRT